MTLRKRMMPLVVGRELAAQVHVRLRRVLILVVAFRRRVPHVDVGAARPVVPSYRSRARVTKIGSPGVGERTIDPPFSVRGESIRQNGPSRLAVVCAFGRDRHCSCRHTSDDTPSEPAIEH